MESALHRNANKRSKIHASLTAANDGVLPTDMLRDIDVLLCLPADELCCLCLICRSWRSLISDPIFAKAHSFRHPLIVGIGNGRRDKEVQFIDLFSGGIVKQIPFMDQRRWDGHELRANHSRVYHSEGFGTGNNCVLNPAIGSFTMFPTTSRVTDHGRNHVILYASVFGWVPSISEYKALRIHYEKWHRDSEPEQSYRIARLGTDGSGGSSDISWTVKPCPAVHVSIQADLHSAVVNGVAYFLLRLDLATSDEIAAFDLATEEWRHSLLRGPLSCHNIRVKEEDMVCFSLANLNSCLVTICSYIRGFMYEDCSVELWFLVDADKEVWTKRYSLRSANVDHPHGTFTAMDLR